MSRVLTVEKLRGRRVVRVHFDDAADILLAPAVAAQAGIAAGSELTADELARLVLLQNRHETHAAALRLLSYRQRSQAEMRRRLTQRGLPQQVVDEEIERLVTLGLLDDRSFAEGWVRHRSTASPRGRRAVEAELRQRGVDRETAAEAVTEYDEVEAALGVARKALRSLRGTRDERERRLIERLARRGFPYAVARRAALAALEEQQPAQS